jgi:hypothetical protein
LTAEVPLGVVTVTSTVPAPEGALTVSEVELTTLMEVPGFADPKSTAVAPVKPVPVTVTEVPPAAGPLLGLTPVTVGAGAPPEHVGHEIAVFDSTELTSW